MKIFLIKIDNIGDNILFLPFVNQLIQDNHEVFIITNVTALDLYLNIKIKTLKYNKSEFKKDKGNIVFSINSKGPYDVLINASFSPRDDSIYLSKEIQSKKKYSFAGNRINLLRFKSSEYSNIYTKLIDVSTENTPEILKNKILYKQIFNSDLLKYVPKITISRTDKEKVLGIFRKYNIDRTKLIVLFSGVGSKIREYYNFNSALTLFSKKHHFQVVALGAKGDFDINQSNLPACCKTLNLSGKLSLNESLALISLSKCALGGETGLAHACIGLNVPHAIVLGGGHIGRFMPYSCYTVPIIVDLDCIYCNWNCTQSSNFCITDVSAQSISSALSHAWNFDSSKNRVFVQGSKYQNNKSKKFQKFITHFNPFELINKE
ncbi:hypothetical protein N9H45_07060 [Opitutales bacterium]|nr:hypothetical protein [Opitutales bacterium]